MVETNRRSNDHSFLYDMGQRISAMIRSRSPPKFSSCIFSLLLTFYLAAPIASQLYTSNDFAFDAGRSDRSTEESFEEFNDLPRYRKREMQSELLQLFGLKQRPKPVALRGGTNNSAPQFMLDLYNSLQSSVEDEIEDGSYGQRRTYSGYHRGVLSSMLRMGNYNYTSSEIEAVDDADTIMSLPVLYRKQSLERHGPHRYHFGLSTVPSHDILTSAELRVYREPPANVYVDDIFTLNVYQIGGQSEGGNILMDSFLIDNNNRGWIVFDVTEGSRILQTYPGARYTLQLKVVDTRGHEIDPNEIGLKGIGENEQQEPFMVAFFKANEHNRREQLTRSRRSKSSGKKNKKSNNARGVQNVQNDPIPENLYERVNGNRRKNNRECRKKSFYVSFARLDWTDWIIAPTGYHAYYCSGECSFPLHSKLNATNHAIVQTLVHIMEPASAPQACCAPTKTSPIEVLYYDSFNVIMRKYKHMVVKACGCH